MDIKELVAKYENVSVLGQKMYFDAEEFVTLAEYYRMDDDLDEAEKIINIAMGIHPDNFEIMLLNGEMLMAREKYTEAIDYLNSISESPDMSDEESVDLALLKIETYLNLNNFEAADIAFNAQFDCMGDEDLISEFLFNVSEIYCDFDYFDEAAHVMERAYIRSTDNLKVIKAYVYTLQKKGDFEGAIILNLKWVDQDPYSFDAWSNLGILYIHVDENINAIEAFDFALTINDSDPMILIWKAYALFFSGNFDEAIITAEKSRVVDPDNSEVYNILFDFYRMMGNYDKMFEVINDKAIKCGFEGVIVMKAQAYLYMKNYEKALEYFNQVPYEDKDTFEYYNLQGDICLYKDDLDGAISAFNKVIEDDPENEYAYDQLAEIYMRKEDYIVAAEYLEQLINIYPSYPDAKKNLAFARFEIGEKEPFDEILARLSVEQLNSLLISLTGNDKYEDNPLDRETIIKRLDEARENRNLFKNLIY